MTNGLHGKTVLITGAGGGIGRETALTLAREGTRIASLDLDGDASGQLGETHRATGVEAVAILAEDFVVEVRDAIDHQVLIGKIQGRIHHAKEFYHFKAVETADLLVHRLQNGNAAFLRRRIALFDVETVAEFAFYVRYVARGQQGIPQAGDHIQIGLFRVIGKFYSQFLCFCFCAHGRSLLK